MAVCFAEDLAQKDLSLVTHSVSGRGKCRNNRRPERKAKMLHPYFGKNSPGLQV